MAITSRDGLISASAAGRRAAFFKSSFTTVAGRTYSLFRTAGSPSSSIATPSTTGSTLTRSSAGALAIPAPSTITYLAGFSATFTTPGVLMLYDRLVETGGLSGTVTTAQTVNSVALPSRATGALDVELWLEVYSALGATPSATVTASYTNQAGTSGRTATLVGGITASWAANTSVPFALQAGDTGVQSVQSVTSTVSTATAGSFGVVLRRVICRGQPGGNSATANGFALGWAETALEVIADDACLELIAMSSTTTLGSVFGDIEPIQG